MPLLCPHHWPRIPTILTCGSLNGLEELAGERPASSIIGHHGLRNSVNRRITGSSPVGGASSQVIGLVRSGSKITGAFYTRLSRTLAGVTASWPPQFELCCGRSSGPDVDIWGHWPPGDRCQLRRRGRYGKTESASRPISRHHHANEPFHGRGSRSRTLRQRC